MTSDSENQYVDATGVRYVAQDNVKACDGCEFDTADDPCLALPLRAAPCSAGARTDGRNIIWIKA